MPATKSTRPLTPLMLAALQTATPRKGRKGVLEISTLTSGATAKGLRDRDLITLDGALTKAGLQVHAKANPAPAEPAPALPTVVQYAEPRGLAAVATILDEVPATTVVPRQNGKTAAAEAPPVPEVQASTSVQEPMRHRFHGKTLGQRRDRRKAQRAARRTTRSNR